MQKRLKNTALDRQLTISQAHNCDYSQLIKHASKTQPQTDKA